MPRTIHCPSCNAPLRIPAGYDSDVFRCPRCRKQSSLTDLEEDNNCAEVVLAPVPRPPDIPERNPIKRYARYVGTRSFIFQVILFGWTAFMILVSLGLVMTTLMERPRDRIEQDAQAAAFGTMSCCSCGGYCLFAIPLAIAAIATLETRKKS